MDNAVKYAKEGKTIDVCVRRCGARTVEIRVTDHGPGIPREEQRRVFERFVRGKGARDKHVRGSGIGLALVQHIARSHGGHARVESEFGKGASFFLSLPLRTPRSSTDAETQLAAGSVEDSAKADRETTNHGAQD
jgi:two-component system phosphate regulon sensor histidine kinase PhoR